MRIFKYGVPAILVAVFLTGYGWSQSQGPAFMGMDLFGTNRFTIVDVQQEFGDQIKLFALKNGEELRSKPKKPVAQKIQRQIEEAIRRKWKLAWVRLSWMDYYKKDGDTSYVTVDVVEPQDVKARMPFRAIPHRRFTDISGLLDAWTQYTEAGWALVRSGEISPDRASCPAFYCTWGAQTAELKEYQEKFVKLVPSNEGRLEQILVGDKDPVHRANAAYLLSYISSGDKLSFDLQAPLRDPDSEVRGAAMKVYSDLAIYHKNVYLPIDKITALLDYPMAEDRSKALAVVVGLADQSIYRDYLIGRAASVLLKLLQLKQPANHDLAYAALGMLSKENFDAADTQAWQAWIRQAQASLLRNAPPPSGKQ